MAGRVCVQVTTEVNDSTLVIFSVRVTWLSNWRLLRFEIQGNTMSKVVVQYEDISDPSENKLLASYVSATGKSSSCTFTDRSRLTDMSSAIGEYSQTGGLIGRLMRVSTTSRMIGA